MAASLDPIIALTRDGMTAVNSIIVDRMQSEIDLIPQLAGHLVASGGKRIRPMLTLASAMMAGETPEAKANAAKLAAAVEFIHTATLLHDDVIDESNMRRGQQTANAIWGNEASVLVGDFLFARAFELMVETGNIHVLGRLSNASARITEGEIQQLMIAGKPDTDIDDYLSVIIGKTAELFAAAAEAGGMIAGGDDALNNTLNNALNNALPNALKDYGMALGIAFQITDDALDYDADETRLGKNVGDDFAEGKTTLPVMMAYHDGDADEKAFWQRTLGDGDIGDGDLAHAQALITKHDTISRSLAEARRHAEAAEQCLAPFPASPARDGLMEAARFAASRAV
ncbi:MAG: polyprenyl synthetase family protein [Alphaproteobacteria bacterium]|nr:polyprenyl synthetase family protein [Alphaproteobacteria bacterium]